LGGFERKGLFDRKRGESVEMAQRVNLDAMIRREDFAREIKDAPAPETIRELNISQLQPSSPLRRQLRKPDFQRETNHWVPDQVVKLLKSFIDGDVIPSVILWRSTNFVFVIDGAHRLSALCAWISDDYGDRTISNSFYSGEITNEQRKIAERTRALVNKTIGSFSSLEALVGQQAAGLAGQRAGAMFTRPIYLQTVVGTAKTAEDSFFAINSQGTPLDETEEFLIRNRRKAVAIAARAVVRAGLGHPYWSSFDANNQAEIVSLAAELHKIIFEPEVSTPLKTLDLPLGGSSSPVDALAVLVDYLTVANIKPNGVAPLEEDETGENTVAMLRGGLRIAHRITGNTGESLGLHPAVYFANDRGKSSRFLFLGMTAVITEKIRNNDDGWFRKFTLARRAVERFLIDNKSLIGIVLQNLSKKQRIPKMRELFNYLVSEANTGKSLEVSNAFSHIGLSGRIFDVTATKRAVTFDDDTKSQIFYREAINHAHACPICGGLLDHTKSVSYDHRTPVRDGGLGVAENGQMVHPYCNTAMKN
jgi:hypothetical protein